MLPTEKTGGEGVLETKTVVLFGDAGIGKSTLASEWAGGNVGFFDCAGELDDIPGFKMPVTDWTSFREWCWAVADSPGTYGATAIDTADMLGTYCAQFVRKKLGIVHESDAEWGKGWTMVREEFASHIAKLAAIPGQGLLLISHAKDLEIKGRTRTYNRQVPTLTGGVRDACVNMADLVLHIAWSDDGESRVIHTKPAAEWEAKERGNEPRLPAEIAWPLGKSGYDVLREAWYGKEK